MIMSTSDENSTANDDSNNLPLKNEKVIQPLSSGQSSTLNITGSSDDLLAELRAKTAALADQVKGVDHPSSRTLVLDSEKLDEEIIDALQQDRVGSIETRRTSKDLKDTSNPAVELVRNKLARLYKKEPDAAEEALESYQAGAERSKHQEFMYTLSTSGKSLADIQTEWHEYYTALSDDEKHSVWKEFYEAQNHPAQYAAAQQTPAPQPEKTTRRTRQTQIHASEPQDQRTVNDIKEQLMNRVNAGGKLTAVHHAKSLLFGLGLAAFVGLVITFTFFNEVFVAPFISPSRSVSATPIIGSQTGEVGPDSKIIIPKINLEVPVVFDLTTVDEATIQNSLENGVVHYATSPNPGETGNSVIVGHSSNNILNSGKYKFAFVLLKRLEIDDTFFVQRGGQRYTYKVYKKEIVGPNDVSVLDTQEKPNTMTLITCDPPGTSINRLIVTAEQIAPDPAGNKPSTAIQTPVSEIEQLPSNAPSLWSRLWPF